MTFAIRLRKRLLVRGTHRWNGCVREVTAELEGLELKIRRFFS